MIRILTAAAGLLMFVASATAQQSDVACKNSTAMLDKMQEKMIVLVNQAGEQLLLRARIADEPAEQAAGFQYVCPQVIQDTAILFVFDSVKQPVFHMNNVHASLDIAFIEKDGRIGDIQLMPEELSSGIKRLYPTQTFAKYALEVRQGFFAENDIAADGSYLKAYD